MFAILLLFFINMVWSVTNTSVSNEIALPDVKIKSLIFVFDISGSMSPELHQVKKGVSTLLKNLTKSTAKLIDRFVFVPFKDPGTDVGPVWYTYNLEEFKTKLENIYVDGGGDCPEMSLTALAEGLSWSSNTSNLFLITDAHPKDTSLLLEIMSLVRQKECQVFFLLTGSCKDDEIPIEFQKIAAVSSGQVFNLLKSDIAEVLKFIQFSFLRNRVNLLTVDILNTITSISSVRMYPFFVDESVTEILISLSGVDLNFNISSPNTEKEIPSEWILKLKSVKVLKIEYPASGIWNIITLGGLLSYSLRVTGSSTLDFVYGFSTQFTSDIEETICIPFKGTMNYLLLRFNLNYPVNITAFELMMFNGTILAENPLHMIENTSVLLFSGSFQLNDENFRIQVKGITKSGAAFRRVTGPVIQPDDSAFLILLPGTVTVNLNSNYSLTCKIQSFQPFEAQWRKNGVVLSTNVFNHSGHYHLLFERTSYDDIGNYSCVVIRQKEIRSKNTYLRIISKPSILFNLSKAVELDLYDDYLIHCNVMGHPKPYVTWVYNKNAYSPAVDVKHNLSVGGLYNVFAMPNGALLFVNILVNQSGNYSCIAVNEAGGDIKSVDITIRGTSNGQPSSTIVKIKEDQKAVLNCPGDQNVQWKKNNESLNWSINDRADEPHYILSRKRSRLRIVEVSDSDVGDYSCTFRNASGLHEQQHFRLEILTPLFFINEKNVTEMNNIKVNERDDIIFDCLADGYPPPSVTWWKHGLTYPVTKWTLPNISYNYLNKQVLRIWPVNRVIHLGAYKCVLKNEISTLQKVFRLI